MAGVLLWDVSDELRLKPDDNRSDDDHCLYTLLYGITRAGLMWR